MENRKITIQNLRVTFVTLVQIAYALCLLHYMSNILFKREIQDPCIFKELLVYLLYSIVWFDELFYILLSRKNDMVCIVVLKLSEYQSKTDSEPRKKTIICYVILKRKKQ